MRWIVVVLLMLGLGTGAVAAEESPWDGQTVLVTGANRGLGLEFARQLQAAGADVIGTARKPEKAEELKALGVRVVQLDVTDEASVAALVKELDGVMIDVLLNNAGIFLEYGKFESADPASAMTVYDVNVLGPMRVIQALLPNLRASERKMIMNMSSGLGSIANNNSGGMVAYRSSKAALNMQTRTLAADLAEEEFICIAMSPGWVRTDMGGENATLSPAESVSGMLSTLAPLTPENTGTYLNYDATELPW